MASLGNVPNPLYEEISRRFNAGEKAIDVCKELKVIPTSYYSWRTNHGKTKKQAPKAKKETYETISIKEERVEGQVFLCVGSPEAAAEFYRKVHGGK